MSSTMTDAEIWNAYLMYCNGVEPKKPQQILLWSKKESSVPNLKFGDSQRIFKAFVGRGVTLNPNTVNKLMEKTDNTPQSVTSTTPTSNTSTPTTSSKPVIKESQRTVIKKKVKSRTRTMSTEEMPQSVNWIKSQPPKKSTSGGVLKKTHSRRNSVEPLKIDSGSGETLLSAYYKNKNKNKNKETTSQNTNQSEEPQQPPPQKPPQPPPQQPQQEPPQQPPEPPQQTQTLPPPPPNMDDTPQQEEETPNESQEEEEAVTTKLPPPPPTNTGNDDVNNEEQPEEEEIQVSKPPVNPLFAQLQQGTGITSGLKKVTPDMKTKNRKDRSGVVKSTPKKPQNKKTSQNNNNKQVERQAKFSKEGNKFIAEYYNEGTVEFNEAKMINEVWVMNSRNSNYLVKNKVKNVLISGCNKIAIEIQDVITTLEIVNSNNVKLYIKGNVPSIQLDKCNDPTLIIFKSALETKIPKIISSLCSNLEIQMPNKDNEEEWNTVSVPYQFETTIDPETKKMVTVPVSHN